MILLSLDYFKILLIMKIITLMYTLTYKNQNQNQKSKSYII